MSYLMDGTMVKVSSSDEFVYIRLVSRKHPELSRFLLLRESFLEWLRAGIGKQHIEKDCGNYLEVTQYQGLVRIRITRLSERGGGDLTGYWQAATVPQAALLEAVESGKEKTFLSYDGQSKERLHFDFSGANKTLRQVIADPRKKRALSKALRDRLCCKYSESIRALSQKKKTTETRKVKVMMEWLTLNGAANNVQTA